MNSPSIDRYERFYDSDDEVHLARRISDRADRAQRTAAFVNEVRTALVVVQLQNFEI